MIQQSTQHTHIPEWEEDGKDNRISNNNNNDDVDNILDNNNNNNNNNIGSNI